MKITLLLLTITSSFPLFAQINLIPNSGFEVAKSGRQPECNYYYDNQNDLGFNNYDIDNDIQYWINARVKHISTSLKYKSSSPDWHKEGFNCTTSPFSYSRHIFLSKRNERYQDAIITSLLNKMNPTKNYIFKINFAQGLRKDDLIVPGANRLKIWLTKYGYHWSSDWGNLKISYNMYPPVISAGWQQHWHILDGPLMNSSYFGNIFKDLNNIVLDCANDHAYIDYVELSENCPNPLLIENHQFYNNVNEIPYKAASILKAGFDVGNPLPNGNVVVNSGAKATFKAGSQIILEPGVIVEQGADFETIFEPCNSNTAKVDNEIIVIDEKTIQIGDITIYDDRVETLACSDTLRIFGLDGDTTSFVNYFWDFGNGQTSDNPIGEVYYDKPGEYKVKLVLTDSSGVTDTLSKIYIRPDCKGKTNRLSNDTTNNKSNTVSYLSPTIFPNPTSNNINITQLNNFIGGNIEIINLMGQVIFTTTINTNQLSADLSKHPKGIYLVKISSNKEQVIEKIVLE